MKLIVQPDAGLAPVITAIKLAKKTIDIMIFRLDRTEVTRALEAAVARGWLDRRRTVLETLTSIRRAGADLVLTYWATEAAGWLH